MSYLVILSGSTFNEKQWAGKVVSLLNSGEGWNPLQVCRPAIHSGLLPACHLILDGSSRGVYVEQRSPNGLQLMVPPLASRMDWTFLFRMVWEAQQLGAEVSEDGDYLRSGFEKERVEQVYRHWWNLSHEGAKQAVSDGSAMTSRVTGTIQMSVPAECFGWHRESFAKHLADAMQRLASAVPCPVHQHRNFRIADWKNVPSLIAKECDIVLVPPNGNIYEQGVGVETKVLRTLMLEGDPYAVEDAGAWWYVRGLDLNKPADRSIMQRLLENPAEKTLPQGGASADDEFMQKGMQLLMDGPLYVFLLIAAADGKIERKEVDALGKTLTKAGENNSFGDLFTTAIFQVGQDLDAAFARVSRATGVEDGVALVFMTIARMVESLPPEIGGPYKKGLLHLATEIAKASGGFFSKYGKESARGLQALKELLG